MIRWILAAVGRFLDAILPAPAGDADFPATEAEATTRRERLRRRLLEKQGHGGNR